MKQLFCTWTKVTCVEKGLLPFEIVFIWNTRLTFLRWSIEKSNLCRKAFTTSKVSIVDPCITFKIH